MSQDNHPVELESQFILRLPPSGAAIVRDALKSGNLNLKDRLKLRFEDDMRKGMLYLDNLGFPSKVVDLPCIIEAHKSIDKKVVYKTADVCQMLLCMEEEEPPEEETGKQKKKMANKVDKKYIWPHGVTPPLKNVRKRRFRKTLKKKQYLDQPEIEKEVRQLLRADYEAHHVSWEVIDEEEDKTKEGGGKDVLMHGSKTNEKPQPSERGGRGLGAEELFGDALSDSENEDELLDDESRISIPEDESSRLSDSQSLSMQEASSSKDKKFPTSFSKDMFTPHGRSTKSPEKQRGKQHRRASTATELASLSRAELQQQLNDLRQQLTEISTRKSIQETELSTTDNAALKSRLETVLNKLAQDLMEKQREIQEVEMLLNQGNF